MHVSIGRLQVLFWLEWSEFRFLPVWGTYAPESAPEMHIFRWFGWGPVEIRVFCKGMRK